MDREKLKAEILRYLDSDLSPEEERALIAAIRGDREAEDLLAELMRFTGNIASVLSESASERDSKRDLDGRPARSRAGMQRLSPTPGPSVVTGLLVAAGIAAAILIAVALSGSEEPPRKPKAPPIVKREEPREVPPPPIPLPEKKATPPELPPLPPAPKPDKPSPTPALEVPKAPLEPPKPQPLPVPPPAPPQPEPAAPRTTKAEVAIAVLEGIKDDVVVKGDGVKTTAREGLSLLAGQGIETAPGEAAVTLRLTDGTRLDLAPDTRIDPITSREGRKFDLVQGILSADVKKQLPGQALVIATPHAEARVIGTKFTLTVKGDSTRLDVQEGRVRLTRLSDGAFTEVGPGFFAVAAAGPRPTAKKVPSPNPKLLLSEDFDNAAGFDARWQLLADGFPSSSRGKLDIDLSPRPGDPYAAGGWHLPGGARVKQGIPLPFRLSVDVEVSARHDNLNALLAMVPASAKGGVIKNELAVRLRGSEYAVLVENNKMKTAAAAGAFPLKSRWVVELDRQELRFWADGKEIGRQAHGLTITEDYKIELQGQAKADVPAGRGWPSTI